jgi:hypothetical protein
MLTAGATNKVAFNVNVMGTSVEPKVRLILKTNPELSFQASKSGDQWVATLDLPSSILPGDYDISVEVILNNRLFCPLTKKIAIDWMAPKDVPTEVMTSPDEIVAAAEKFEEIKKTELKVEPKPSLFKTFEGKSDDDYLKEQQQKDFINIFKNKPKIKESSVVKKDIIKPVSSLELTKLSERVAQPVVKSKPVITPIIEKPVPIKIKISEVDAATSKTDVKIVESLPKVKAKLEAKKPSGSLIRLIKEQLIYE